MKKFTINTLIIGLIFWGSANAIAYLALRQLRHSCMYPASFLVNQFKPGEKFDYIILGTSGTLTGLNSILIDSLIQSRGLNLSTDNAGPSSQYLMLQHFIKNGFKTKYCILHLQHTTAEYNKAFYENDYRFLPFIQDSIVQQYYKQREPGFKFLYYSRYFPILGVAKYNQKIFYPALMATIKPQYRNRFDEFGNYTFPNVQNVKTESKPTDTTRVSISNPALKDIEQLCKKNGIQIIYYIAPILHSNIIFEGLDQYYLCDNSQLFCNDGAYFYDKDHVNQTGRRIATISFAKFLAENGLFPNTQNLTSILNLEYESFQQEELIESSPAPLLRQ